ncbi:YqhG family protein [Brevibacillus fulvus]|uniref:Uncharacterized protein n=1 Tax=Brevibacillus fulvus TaxID=1125967 RepID=A0A938XZU7_9BACL|nr:YqhG family protein [Brevibacillus fulvus]MBM7588550.1 hypothetical protein [Brevibacillus fulvus]
MNQLEVRQYVEKYFAAFSAHVIEAHPDYLTVKLPPEVDKDIGNRPFYWSWVEKMNITPQPMILTFLFHPDRPPEGIRHEPLQFGSARLLQIFQSAAKHGRFVCLYEQGQAQPGLTRRSTALTPWLGVNLKLSFICDKKRDILLYLGVNLHQPRIVHHFYPFLRTRLLSPAIPDYYYTLERNIDLQQAAAMIRQEVEHVIAQEDAQWAAEARKRLQEELDILEAYYAELALREAEVDDEPPKEQEVVEHKPSPTADSLSPQVSPQIVRNTHAEEAVPEAVDLEQFRTNGGRILDFLRQNGIPESVPTDQPQPEWKKSTPEEEKERRIAELRWQYEPRIEVNLINAGLFYLQSSPTVVADNLRGNM